MRIPHSAPRVKARNKVNTLLYKAKRRFEKNIARNSKPKPKSSWKHVTRKVRTKSGISPFLENIKYKTSMKFDDGKRQECYLNSILEF